MDSDSSQDSDDEFELPALSSLLPIHTRQAESSSRTPVDVGRSASLEHSPPTYLVPAASRKGKEKAIYVPPLRGQTVGPVNRAGGLEQG